MLPRLQARLLASGFGRQRSVVSRGVRVVSADQQQQQEGQQQQAAAAAAAQHSLSLVASTPTATQLLAHFFACELHPADCYLLYGSVGAGKSYFRYAEGHRCRQLVGGRHWWVAATLLPASTL